MAKLSKSELKQRRLRAFYKALFEVLEDEPMDDEAIKRVKRGLNAGRKIVTEARQARASKKEESRRKAK